MTSKCICGGDATYTAGEQTDCSVSACMFHRQRVIPFGGSDIYRFATHALVTDDDGRVVDSFPITDDQPDIVIVDRAEHRADMALLRDGIARFGHGGL